MNGLLVITEGFIFSHRIQIMFGCDAEILDWYKSKIISLKQDGCSRSRA